MKVKELYESLGGDYAGAMSRLLKEERIVKYLNRFLTVSDYQEMVDGINAQDWSKAFMFSHNMKGMSLNLGLTELGRVSSDICEQFRNGAPSGDVSGMLADVTAEYEKTLDAIRQLEV